MSNDAWKKYLVFPTDEATQPTPAVTPVESNSREVIEGYESELKTEKDKRLTAETALAWALKRIQYLEQQFNVEPDDNPRREMALEILPEYRKPHDPDAWKKYLAIPPQNEG